MFGLIKKPLEDRVSDVEARISDIESYIRKNCIVKWVENNVVKLFIVFVCYQIVMSIAVYIVFSILNKE